MWAKYISNGVRGEGSFILSNSRRNLIPIDEIRSMKNQQPSLEFM